MGYPRKRKEAVLKKMLPPGNKPISEIAREEGISEGTLYNWRKAARAQDRLMPDGDTSPSGWGGIRQVRRSAGNNLNESSRVIHVLSTKKACIPSRLPNGARRVNRPTTGIGRNNARNLATPESGAIV